MRKIDSIIVHCSATKAGQDFTAADIDRWHRERGRRHRQGELPDRYPGEVPRADRRGLARITASDV